MSNIKKGLADTGNGEFILNESGTSVSTDKVEDNQGLSLQSPWDEVKEKLKENDPGIADEDLEYAPGKEKELFERLQKKMNRTPEQIKEYIESVSANTTKAG
jgi:hypothetical protein